MGNGSRIAYTRDPKSTIDNQNVTKSSSILPPGSCVPLGFLSSTSNPSTPLSSLRRSQSSILSLFRNSSKYRSSCSICSNSVKTGQGMAIYTAECDHSFHFPCIASHVTNNSTLTCPICNTTWINQPYLAQQDDVDAEKPIEVRTNNVDPPNHQLNHSDSVRIYKNDDPHLSPFAKVDENDDEEDQNGKSQGIFAKSKPLSQINELDSRTVTVKLMPECAFISVSQSHETHALVLRVKAPPRAPIDLVTVLDVGAAMNGSMLRMLKLAMSLVISSLDSSDRLAIIASLANSKRLLPLHRMTVRGQRVARRVVERFGSNIGTGVVEDALRKAAKVLEDRSERNPFASIVLLSDGDDKSVPINKKNERRSFNHVSSIRSGDVSIPVHYIKLEKETGFSSDLTEQELGKRVEGILSLVARDLSIQLGVSDSAEIKGVYSCYVEPTALSLGPVRLGDLNAKEERDLLVDLRVSTSASRSHHVITARCVYKDPASDGAQCVRSHALLVEIPPNGTLPGGSRAEKLRNVFITSRAMAESRKLAAQSEFSKAYQLLAEARKLLVQYGSAPVKEYLRGLEVEREKLRWREKKLQKMVAMRRRSGSERKKEMRLVDKKGKELTLTSIWKMVNKLAKMTMLKKYLRGQKDVRFQ